MISDKNRALIVFARTPIQGSVKKRLAQTIGEQSALYCYNLLLNKAIASSTKVAARRFLYFHPRTIETLPGTPRPLAADFTLCRQNPEADLGQKMLTAFTEVLQHNHCELALLIGSDIPFLETDIIELAFSKLAAADIVLGPAPDGGYYLIGLKRRSLNRANFFVDMPWGTDQVFKTTVTRAQATGLTIATLPPLFDVDLLDDLKTWQQQEKDPAIAAHLLKILAGLKEC